MPPFWWFLSNIYAIVPYTKAAILGLLTENLWRSKLFYRSVLKTLLTTIAKPTVKWGHGGDPCDRKFAMDKGYRAVQLPSGVMRSKKRQNAQNLFNFDYSIVSYSIISGVPLTMHRLFAVLEVLG